MILSQERLKASLDELKASLVERFGPAVDLTLFGSVARGSFGADSDIDVLVLIPSRVSTDMEEEVFDLAFDVELKYDVVFGIIVYSREEWESPRLASMPLHHMIEAEGVRL
jgi:predicted nucleotidyltransferase